MDVVLTYDVADTDSKPGARRLRRLAKVCERYGQRVQFSVFECRLSPTRLARMLGEVRDVIDPELDSVILYRFPGRLDDSRAHVGKRADRELGGPWVV